MFFILNESLGNCTFSVQSDGAYVTYVPTGGADTVTKKLGSGNESFTIPQIALVAGGFTSSRATSNLKFDISNFKTLNIESFSAGWGTLAIYGDDTQLSIAAGTDADISNYNVLKIVWSYPSTSQVSLVGCTLNNIVFSN